MVRFETVLAALATLACVASMPSAPRDLVAIHGRVAVGGEADPAHLSRRLVSDEGPQLLDRRAGNSENEPFSMWPTRPAPTLADTMEELGLHPDDLGAHPIASFRHLRQTLFPRTPRSQETLQELASIYHPYQSAHPQRGARVNLEDQDVFVSLMLDEAGRNRIRDIRAILDHLIEQAHHLGLDPIRVQYLDALRERFRISRQLLSPTPEEIIERGTRGFETRMRAEGASNAAASSSLPSELARTTRNVYIRTRLAENNVHRFELDFGLLQDLENDLDELVRGASIRMATGFRGRHIFRRDVWQQESIEPNRKETPIQARRTLSRRRVIPSSSSSDAVQPPPLEMAALQHWPERTRDRTIWSLASVLRGEQPPLLPMIHHTPQHRDELLSRFRRYQTLVPVHGHALDLGNAQLLMRLWMDDVGRDRFRRIEPIVSYLLTNREALNSGPSRVRLLRALERRFREAYTWMSPTLDNFDREQQRTRRAMEEGRMSEAEYLSMVQAIEQGRAGRSMRVMSQGVRFTQDLRLIPVLERELEVIAGQAQHVREVARHLQR